MAEEAGWVYYFEGTTEGFLNSSYLVIFSVKDGAVVEHKLSKPFLDTGR